MSTTTSIYELCSPCFPYIPTTPLSNPPFELDNSITTDIRIINISDSSPTKEFFGYIDRTTTPQIITSTTTNPPIIFTTTVLDYDCIMSCKKLKF